MKFMIVTLILAASFILLAGLWAVLFLVKVVDDVEIFHEHSNNNCTSQREKR